MLAVLLGFFRSRRVPWQRLTVFNHTTLVLEFEPSFDIRLANDFEAFLLGWV